MQWSDQRGRWCLRQGVLQDLHPPTMSTLGSSELDMVECKIWRRLITSRMRCDMPYKKHNSLQR